MPKPVSLSNYSIDLSLVVSRDGVPVKTFLCRREIPPAHLAADFQVQAFHAVILILQSFVEWWFPPSSQPGDDSDVQA